MTFLATQRQDLQKKKKGDKLIYPLLNIFSRECSDTYRLSSFSSDTVNFLRPLARLVAKTLRPFFVAILDLNPCLFVLFLLDG